MESYILHCTFLCLVTQLSLFLSSAKAQDGCQFPHLNGGATPAKMLQAIQALIGRRYSVMSQNQKFRFDIGICIEGPESSEGARYKGVAVLLIENGGGIDRTKKVIGKYTNTKIIKGTNWVLLEYGDGDRYSSHCGMEARRARIVITCDESIPVGQETIRLVEWFHGVTGTNDCYYLFEMQSSVACQKAVLAGKDKDRSNDIKVEIV